MGRIEIVGVGRRFKGTVAVENVSLTAEDGDFLVLLGPSGCGKTTLLRMLAGLLEPTAGSIVLDGIDITDQPAKKRDLAMVFQSYALYPHLSVFDNLAFPLRVRRIGKDAIAARVNEVASILEIGHLLDRKPKALSGGQRQRVAVGRALVRSPKAFLMDEPLSNLDAKLRTATRHELVALHRELGATFVYVTHDQVEAMTMATRIALLNRGALEQVGTPEEVYDRPASVFVAGFLGSPPMNLFDAGLSSTAGRIVVETADFTADLWAGNTEPRDVVLGVRPENLSLATSDIVTGGLRVNATIETVEKLGHEEILYTRTGTSTVVVRTPRGQHHAVGDSVVLSAPAERLHLFDRASGLRLEWVPDAPARRHEPALSASVS